MRLNQRGPRLGALAFFVSTLLVVMIMAPRPLSAQDPGPDLKEGQRLVQQGLLLEALEAFSRHKRAHPDDPLGYYFTGIVLGQRERWQEAAAELRRAVEIDPKEPSFRLALAAALGRLSQWEEAIQALSPLDGENLSQQTDPASLWLLADLYFQAEKTQDALRVLDRFDQVEPDSLRSHIRRAQIALLEGRFEVAVSRFRQALEKAPQEAAVHHGLGLALWRAGETAQAEEALQKAVQLEPSAGAFRLDLGKLLVDLGRPLEAIEALEPVVQGQDAPPQAYFELSRAHRRAGHSELSRRYLQLFRQADRGQEEQSQSGRAASSAVRRGQELLQSGQVNQARQAFLDALREDSGNWLAHSYLAKIYLSSGQFGAAGKHLSRMLEIDPESAEGNFLWATLLYQRRDYARAMEAAQKAKEARPDYAALRNLLGNLHLALGEREKAIKEYEAAVRLEPQRSDFRLNLEAARKKP